jgi:hypothetical protein
VALFPFEEPGFVIHETGDTAIDAWVTHDDHYYVNECADSLGVRTFDGLNPWSGNEFRHCVQCYEEHKADLVRQAQQLQRFGPLRGLEPFAGLTSFFVAVTDFNMYSKVRVALEPDWCLALWRQDTLCISNADQLNSHKDARDWVRAEFPLHAVSELIDPNLLAGSGSGRQVY